MGIKDEFNDWWGNMTEKREKYLTELQKAYQSMVQALANCETENAEQTLVALNEVSRLFLTEYNLHLKANDPYRKDTEEEGIKLIKRNQ